MADLVMWEGRLDTGGPVHQAPAKGRRQISEGSDTEPGSQAPVPCLVPKTPRLVSCYNAGPQSDLWKLLGYSLEPAALGPWLRGCKRVHAGA